MAKIIAFVSVNKSLRDDMTIDELEVQARAAWPISLAKARECDTLVAVYEGFPVASWQVLDAYTVEETYTTSGGPRPRVAFALGAALPVLPVYWTQFDAPKNLRRGIATEPWKWDSAVAL